MPDQKAIRILRLLVEEVIPITGVPECLLSDRGTNLLSHLMTDVCALLGIKKLNTTSYHPACDGLVERFNRTLKTALRKRAAECGDQWDRYLSGVVWTYRNVPHESTGEKPSFLLYGIDLRSPTEAALFPPTPLTVTDVDDYREELVFSLSTARRTAANSIKAAQSKYKKHCDVRATPYQYKVGSWVFVHFPQEETGTQRKLSRSWRGPYRVVSVQDPDVNVVKVYFPDDGVIKVHQSRVKPSPMGFPAGSYHYKGRKSQGRVPDWVLQFLDGSDHSPEQVLDDLTDQDVIPEIESLFSDESQVGDRVSGLTDVPDCPSDQSVEGGESTGDCTSPTGEPEPEGSSRVQFRSQGRYPLRQAIRKPERLYQVSGPTGTFGPKGGSYVTE